MTSTRMYRALGILMVGLFIAIPIIPFSTILVLVTQNLTSDKEQGIKAVLSTISVFENQSPGFQKRVEAFVSDSDLESLLKSSTFLHLDDYLTKARVLREAAKRDLLHFDSPGQAVTMMRRWYPKYRDDEFIRGEVKEGIDPQWSPEGLAFDVVWDCWPEVTTWHPERDPLKQPGTINRKWPTNLNGCLRSMLELRASSVPSADREKILADTLKVLRSKLAVTLQRATCRETGADDCALLLLELASLAPTDAGLLVSLNHVEKLLTSFPELDHPYRQFAISRVKVAMALASLDEFDSEKSTYVSLLDRAERWTPTIVDWVRRKSGTSRAVTKLSPTMVSNFLVSGLDGEIAMFNLAMARNRKGTDCCILDRHAHLRPLDLIEVADPKMRKRAWDILSGEVRKRAQRSACDPGLARRLNVAAWEGHQKYTLPSQLAFLYSVERAKLGDRTACWDLTLPADYADAPRLLDTENLLAGLIGDETRPFAHFEAERALIALCGTPVLDKEAGPRCAQISANAVDETMLTEEMRFQSHTILANKDALATQIPVAAGDATWVVINLAGCKAEKITVWRHPSHRSALVEPKCEPGGDPNLEYPSEEAELRAPRYAGHAKPLLIMVKGDRADPIVIPETYFMYDETGTLTYVTDMDGDGRLELWFKGTVAECDGDESEDIPCNPLGLRVGEIFGGVLARFQDGTKSARKIVSSGRGLP